MALLKTVFKGESLSILVTFPESYDMARVEDLEIVVGAHICEHTISSQTAIVRLKSEQTQRFMGVQELAISVQDSVIGVYKILAGQIQFDSIRSRYNSEADSDVYGIIVMLSVSETAITVEDVLYNYINGKSAFQLAVEGGYTGTEEEFNEDLATFRIWAELSEQSAEQTAEDRIATGEDRLATGQDRQATGADRLQTGLDVIAANQAKLDAQTAQGLSEDARDKSQEWAENPEDVPVETGKFSALHWSAKASDDADQTAADRIQTGLDAVATATDRIQTGLDRLATGQDKAFIEERIGTPVEVASGPVIMVYGANDSAGTGFRTVTFKTANA